MSTQAYLRGIDCSAYQGVVDWQKVKQDGASFAWSKASEGTVLQDRYFTTNWQGIRAANLQRGAYHFSWPAYNSALREAAWFLSVIPALGDYDMVALDLETGPNDGSDLSAWALTWLEAVEDVLRVPPLLYTYLDFATRLKDPALARYGMWLAAYGPQCPAKVGPWSTVTMWQHSSSASYAGVNGLVDESLIARDLAGLRALGKQPGPKKVVVNVDMLLRSAPGSSHIYCPAQMVYKGATLDVVGGPEDGWVECHAGSRVGWILEQNCRYLT